jgi:hypothetical protein
MRVHVSRLVPGQTRFGIFQNRFPREWQDLWYITIHLAPFYVEIYGS